MTNKLFNKAFWLGFAVVILSFVIFNLLTLTLGFETRIYNRMNQIGFPFAIYEWGGNPYVERILPFGLLMNGAIILINSILVGLLFRFLWKLQTTEMFEQ